MSVIEVDSVSKTFHSAFKRDSVKALDNVSVNVDKGSIFGLLGKNGAGKTTLVKILLGLTFPSSGLFKIFDKEGINSKTKLRVGYLPENHNLPDFLKGRDMMHYFGRLVGLNGAELDKRIDELLELVNMTKWQNKKIKTYSKGMMQRLGLAQAMLNSPDLLFLDEPTDGVDPIGRKEIRDILIKLRSEGTTIFLNSHLLSEVEMITDRIAILNNGRLISEGRVEDYTTAKEEYKISAEGDLTELLSEETVSNYFIKRDEKGSYNIKTKNTEDLNKLIDEIREGGILIKEVSLLKTSLEDIFIDIVKESDNGALN